ncbi:helix-turn-helix domain-containing protein [Streptomyces sp. NPDC002758]
MTELAGIAALSRLAFVERFTARLGRPSAAYLTQARLQRAADLLSNREAPVAAVARAVGYTSDAAFTCAFARRYGMPPGRWRREVQA